MNIQFLNPLKRWFPWDAMAYVTGAIALLSVFVLYASSLTFLFYLYQPVFAPVQTVFLLTPSVDYDLLTQVAQEGQTRQTLLQSELRKAYPDPFSPEP